MPFAVFSLQQPANYVLRRDGCRAPLLFLLLLFLPYQYFCIACRCRCDDVMFVFSEIVTVCVVVVEGTELLLFFPVGDTPEMRRRWYSSRVEIMDAGFGYMRF